MPKNTGSESSARLRVTPTALKVGQVNRLGTNSPWFMGVVLQQACEVMVGRGR